MESYGQGRMIIAAHGKRRAPNCNGLSAMDLRALKADGTRRNFACAADREMAKRMVEEDQPEWNIGSPPCTAFLQLDHLHERSHDANGTD